MDHDGGRLVIGSAREYTFWDVATLTQVGAPIPAAADIVGSDQVSDHAPPATGSEDFADMLQVVPGAYCDVGHSGTTALHNPSFVLDPDILPVGASIMARIVERRLPL